MEAFNVNRLRLSVVSGKKVIKKSKNNPALYKDDKRENAMILERASQYWIGMEPWRNTTERNWRYLKGEQWSDIIYDPVSKEWKKEELLIKAQGQVPLVVNMIAPLVENILGQFRTAKNRPSVIARTREEAPVGDMLTNTLWSIEDANSMWEKDTAALEMMFCSGVVVNRCDWGEMRGKKKEDARFKNVDLTSFIVSPPKDQDYDDIVMVGQFHDMSKNAVIAQFARTKQDEEKIREYFSFVDEQYIRDGEHFSGERENSRSFFFPEDHTRCRIFEIWEKRAEWRYEFHDPAKGIYDHVLMTDANKAKFDRENEQRTQMAIQAGIEPDDIALIDYEARYSSFWYFKFITNDNDTLAEGETPFEHGMHPFKFMFHRLNRGEVRPFISTLIDVQRAYNRDKILLDFVIGASAKGTFYIDGKYLSDDMTIDEAKAEYTKRNGVIRLNLKPGVRVSDVLGQLTSHAVPGGLNESLSMGMQLMQQMGGVSEALQGRMPGGGVPASLYAQSAQNSTLNIRDRLESFNMYRSRRGKMLLDIALQFYDEKRYLTVAGDKQAREFDRAKIREDLEYEMSVGQGTDSQMYKSIMDEWINQYVANGLIPMKIGLKHMNIPGADKLINDLEEYEKSLQQQQAQLQGGAGATSGGIPQPPNITPGLMDIIRQKGADENNANQKAVEMMQRYASGSL
jgi:hypothetical protein